MKPIWELYSALKNLLELTEVLMREAGRSPAPDGAVSRAKTALQIHECAATDQLRGQQKPRPLSEWHEDIGPVLWWSFPIREAPYVGTPNDVDGWPDHHTHWTPIPKPEPPAGYSPEDYARAVLGGHSEPQTP